MSQLVVRRAGAAAATAAAAAVASAGQGAAEASAAPLAVQPATVDDPRMQMPLESALDIPQAKDLVRTRRNETEPHALSSSLTLISQRTCDRLALHLQIREELEKVVGDTEWPGYDMILEMGARMAEDPACQERFALLAQPSNGPALRMGHESFVDVSHDDAAPPESLDSSSVASLSLSLIEDVEERDQQSRMIVELQEKNRLLEEQNRRLWYDKLNREALPLVLKMQARLRGRRIRRMLLEQARIVLVQARARGWLARRNFYDPEVLYTPHSPVRVRLGVRVGADGETCVDLKLRCVPPRGGRGGASVGSGSGGGRPREQGARARNARDGAARHFKTALVFSVSIVIGLVAIAATRNPAAARAAAIGGASTIAAIWARASPRRGPRDHAHPA
jgi:hypothetical protein